MQYFRVFMTGAYVEPSRRFTMELYCKNNYFRKKASSQMFDWVLNTPLHNTLFPCKKNHGALRDHPVSTYAKFSEKLTYLPSDTHIYVCVSGGQKCQFFGRFCLRSKLQLFKCSKTIRKIIIFFKKQICIIFSKTLFFFEITYLYPLS